MRKSIVLGSFLALVVSLTLFTGGCSKEDNEYHLKVIVTVNDSIRVQNALVRVFAPVNNSFVDYFYGTNENGELNVEFQNKAIVELIASKSSFKACSFAEVDRGMNTVVIDLKAFGNTENGCDQITNP